LAAAAPQILVISAEPNNLRLVEGWLSAAGGFRSVSASGTAQALKLISSGGIDLALVDLEPAKDEAFHFCESVRKDAATCRLPLIAIAETCENAALELKGRELGINDYVRRPLEERQLVTQIKNLLQISDAERDRWLLSRLAQSDRLVTLGQLAASVAHEINNPLAFILSNLNTLQNYFDDVKEVITAYRQGREAGATAEKELQLDQSLADVDALLRETADGSRRVRALVFELKGLSRPDSGELEPVDLADVAASTLLLTERELTARAHVVKALQPALISRASRAKLHQVVLNLLVNASQALDGRAPEQCEIRVATRTDGDQAVLSVTDTGCGIPKEQQARIFDLFFTTKPPSVGTGIGLSVCAMVIQRMGGRIDVESVPGQGSTFTVRVPT
jgi:signal transduction histidine kinase